MILENKQNNVPLENAPLEIEVPITAKKILENKRASLEEQLKQGDLDYAKIKAEGNGNDAIRNKIVAETLMEIARLDAEILKSGKDEDEKYSVQGKTEGWNTTGASNGSKRGY